MRKMKFPAITWGRPGPAARILCMLGLTASFMVVELVVGNMANSMALVADSFHMLSDVLALTIAFVSIR